MKRALVVFSGGQDSTTCLFWAKEKYDEVTAVSFLYGQNHKVELEMARNIANVANVNHMVIDISFFGKIVKSALTSEGDVNQQHTDHADLPASFVPNRNAMFLTIAHSIAQKIEAEAVVTGVGESDYSGYPDCRYAFIKSINESLNLGSETEIRIETPLMFLKKKEIWQLADSLGKLSVVRDQTLTCYNGVTTRNEWGMGCGECPSCKLRARGYDEFLVTPREEK